MSRRITISDESFGLLEHMQNLSADDVILMFAKTYIGITSAVSGKSDIPEEQEVYARIQHLVLTVSEYEKLCSKYKREAVDVIISDMKNYSNLKKYKSAYLTANKWLQNRGKDVLAGQATTVEYGSPEWVKRNG